MSETDSLTEEQKLASLLFELYPGLDRAYGKYTVTQQGKDGKKTQGRASTELATYKPDLWVGHLHGAQGLGVVPITDQASCSWGAIDIDKYDLDLVELEKKVHELNLPLLVIRTKSGGAHLTCYFTEPIACKKVRSKLYEFSIALGFGGVEIFPKQSSLASQRDVGNWLNMPYFEYRNTQRYAIFRGKPLQIVQFLDLAERLKVDEETFMGINVTATGNFDDGPPCLQLITKDGKIPEGTRNSTLFAIGVYCRKKWEDEWGDKVEEMNADFIDPPLKSREVQTIVRSLSRKDYFYPCGKTPLQEHCNKDLCKKRTFGIGELEEEFTLNLGSLCKIMTEPPIWIIDVEGVRIQLDTEELIDQTKFRRACMMAINKLPPLMKRVPWEKMIREKLESVELLEAPMETRVNTRVNQYVHQYLVNTPEGDSREEILIGRPWHDKENSIIYFRGNDLIRFLENNGLRIEPRKIWNSLRESGTRHKQLSVGASVAQVWYVSSVSMYPEDLPEPEFASEAF
jgi:hypothetical protein